MAFIIPLSLASVRFSRRCLPCLVTRISPHLQICSLATPNSMSNGALVDSVLKHWFGSSNIPRFDTLDCQDDLWYSGSKEIDDNIRDRFGNHVDDALEGKLDHLMGSKQYPIRGDLALVILLDQYPRNIYRRTAKAFKGDSKAREVVMGILEPDRWSAAKKILPITLQATFLLPLMHQESVADVDLCATKIADLIQECHIAGDEANPCAKRLERMRGYAGRHRDILAQFGRYPHRNVFLGRENTEAELEFLKDGPRFGQ